MSDDPVNLKGIDTIYSFSKSNKKSLPPIEKWNPPFCGDIDMLYLCTGAFGHLPPDPVPRSRHIDGW